MPSTVSVEFMTSVAAVQATTFYSTDTFLLIFKFFNSCRCVQRLEFCTQPRFFIPTQTGYIMHITGLHDFRFYDIQGVSKE